MKISKSKQELARIISENGGWRNGEFAAQDGDGLAGGHGSKPEWNSLAEYWWRKASGGWFLANKIKNHHQTVLSRAEYFHLYPAPDADGWIEWKGGSIDIDDLQLVDYKMRCTPQGSHLTTASMNLVWDKTGEPFDIIAYRLHKQAKPEFCESVMRSIPEPEINSKNINITQVDDINVVESEPTIEQLAADYRNASDYADRKQQEADDAKADADEKLKALEFAGEALGLLVAPITAKQGPELVITDWRDLQLNDIIEYVDGSIKDNIGMTGPVVEFAPDATDGMMVRMKCDNGPRKGRLGWPMKWRFIRRP